MAQREMDMNELEIFQNAIEIADPKARRNYVREACQGDIGMENRVLALLDADKESDGILGDSAMSKVRAQLQNLRGDATEQIEETLVQDSTEDSKSEALESFRQHLEPPTRDGWLGKLEHYEIESILGHGVFGIVAKAFDEKLHRVVAIKMLRPAYASISPPRKRFLREARSAASVTHENLVAVYSVEETPIPYLVMEFVQGQTLQDRMNQTGPLDIAEVLDLSLQIARGLAEAHRANLIHRDIKPANILLSGDGLNRVKISDFGLARTVDDASMTSSGIIAGTPLYMSPEQARGERLDHRSDLFSLGSVMYQMVAGRPPFRAPSTMAVLRRVCDDVPREIQDVIPETPKWLSAVVSKLLEKSPDNRFQSGDEVAKLLSGFVREAGEPILEQNFPNGGIHSRSSFGILSTALGVIAIVAFVAGLVFWFNRPKTTPTKKSMDPNASGFASKEGTDIPLNDKQILDFVRRVGCAVAVGEVSVSNNHITHLSSPPLLSSGKLTFNFSRTPDNQGIPFGDPELTTFVKLIEPRRDIEIEVLNLVETEITNDGLLKLRDIPIHYLQTFRTKTNCDSIANELSKFKVKDWDFGATISSQSIPSLAKSKSLVGLSIDSRSVDPSSISAFAGSKLERLQVWGGRKGSELPSVSDLKRLTNLKRLCLPSYGLDDKTVADLETQLPGVRINRLSFYDQKPRLTEFKPSDSEILSLVESCGGQIEQFRPELIRLRTNHMWPLAKYRINIKFSNSSSLSDTLLKELAELLKTREDIHLVCLHLTGTGVSNKGLESLKQLKITQLHFHGTQIKLGGVDFSEFQISEWVPLNKCDEPTLLALLENNHVRAVGLRSNQLTTAVLNGLRGHMGIGQLWIETESAQELPALDVLQSLRHLQLTIKVEDRIEASYQDKLKTSLPDIEIRNNEIVLGPTQVGRLQQLKRGMRLPKWSTLPLSLTEIEAFRLQFKAKRISGDNALVLQFPYGGSRAGVTLSGFSEVGGYSGLARIDGVPLPQSKHAIPGDVFEDKKTHAVDITVTRDGVTALFDGKTIIKWSGKPEQLSLYTAAAEIDVPLFFQTFSEFHISDLELTRLDKSTE